MMADRPCPTCSPNETACGASASCDIRGDLLTNSCVCDTNLRPAELDQGYRVFAEAANEYIIIVAEGVDCDTPCTFNQADNRCAEVPDVPGECRAGFSSTTTTATVTSATPTMTSQTSTTTTESSTPLPTTSDSVTTSASTTSQSTTGTTTPTEVPTILPFTDTPSPSPRSSTSGQLTPETPSGWTGIITSRSNATLTKPVLPTPDFFTGATE